MPRILAAKRTQRPTEPQYERKRPLMTFSVSPRVLLKLRQLGKNKSGRICRDWLRHVNRMDILQPKVRENFTEKELSMLSQRLVQYGWNDSLAETIISKFDLVKLLRYDKDEAFVQQVADFIEKSLDDEVGLALIHNLEKRISKIREAAKEAKKEGKPEQAQKSDKSAAKSDVEQAGANTSFASERAPEASKTQRRSTPQSHLSVVK